MPVIAPIIGAIGSALGGLTASGVAAGVGAAAAIGSTVAGAVSANKKVPGQQVIPPPNPQVSLDMQAQQRSRSVAGLGYQQSILSGVNYGGGGLKRTLG